MRRFGRFALVFSCLVAGCAAQAQHPDESESESAGTGDLPLGDVEQGLGSSGAWGAATTCKAIPPVEPLKDPAIVVSLDGLTLHLWDRAGDYDRVFPIGPGAIDETGKSKTPTGSFHTGSDTSEVKDAAWGYFYPCKVWWTDPDTGEHKPVFAGLPFIRLSGTPTAGYGIHGPIDRFTDGNGGSLRRGYVSHGCVRMAAADIVEVYGRIHRHARTPVTIQKPVEIRADGTPVSLDARWVGDACEVDGDCTFPGGACKVPSGGAMGVCTLPCSHACPDRAGEVPTFCVKDVTSGSGVCVPQASSTFDNQCARYEGRLHLVRGASRPDGSAHADVCAP